MERKLGIVASCLHGVSERDALEKIQAAGFETFFTGNYKDADVAAIKKRADEHCSSSEYKAPLYIAALCKFVYRKAHNECKDSTA